MTLVVLAAGMGSRFGGGKQTARLGPHGEILLDYSLYDAALAGFDHAVLVVRQENRQELERHAAKAIARGLAVSYAYQEIPSGRRKPYGTGHALLCAAEEVHGPFAVVNADDFYGRDVFFQLARFFREPTSLGCLVGYALEQTLSKNGGVSRGVCRVNAAGRLLTVEEHTQIQKQNNRITALYGTETRVLSPDTPVSLNLWAFPSGIFTALQKEFDDFLPNAGETGEFQLPTTLSTILQKGIYEAVLLPTDASWFGVTHREDAPDVMAALASPGMRALYEGI